MDFWCCCIKCGNMTQTLYFLIDSHTGIRKRITEEDAQLLNILSTISRENKQHQKSHESHREILTVHIGIPGNTGIIIPLTVQKTVHHVVDRYWLVILNFKWDDAGTPSAAMAPLSPAPTSRRASRIYKGAEPDIYNLSPAPLYMSKRGRYYAAPLLPYRGLKASRGHFPPTVKESIIPDSM